MKKDYKISYLIKIVLFLYLLFQFEIEGTSNEKVVILFLLIAAICIIKEKFIDSKYIIIAQIAIITAAIQVNYNFIMLYPISMFDLAYEDGKIGIIFITSASIYFSSLKGLPLLFMMLIIYGSIAYILRNIIKKEDEYRKTFDSERRLRYELENTKAQLLNSSREVARIAEVNERNRIARNIHDNVGHSIAGIFMQLQVVEKLYGKNDEKAKKVLKNCINGLSDALNVVRDTVHNIKPKENLGVEYILNIINNFKFCKIDFVHSGDFSSILPNHYELITTNIKEALTNASKYSSATLIKINIDINEKYIRLLIQDNGSGAQNFKEGLGISGMRERVRNFGGSISVNGEDGFLIVCVVPIKEGSLKKIINQSNS